MQHTHTSEVRWECGTTSGMALGSRRQLGLMSKHIGIPIKVLHDAEGHTVTIELKNGETYRGKLDEAEDNMNCHLSNCTKTAKDGKVTTLSNCFLRGSHVRFMVLPDILKNAPFFKKIDTKAKKAADRGGKAKAAAKDKVTGGERRTPGLPPEKGRTRAATGGNNRNPSFN